MALFGNKKPAGAPMPPAAPMPEEMPAAPAAGIPTDRVVQLRQQGMSNNQIVETLQREGYSTSQVYDAMSQADIKGIVESPGGAPPMPPAPGTEMPAPPGAEMPAGVPAEMPPPPMPAMPAAEEGLPREKIEEVAESIIDEKWDALMKSVDRIVEWKESIDKKITKMEHEVKALKSSFDDLHKGVLGKISEYDKGIRSVGTDIKAMEGVFKKVLPTLTQSVGELSRVTKKIKKNK